MREGDAEGRRRLLFFSQMTGLLFRHIFDVTFHFGPPLEICGRLMGHSHSLGLNLTVHYTLSLFGAADAFAWVGVVLVATLAYC